MHNYDIPTSEYNSENSIHEMENDSEYEQSFEHEDESYEYENEADHEFTSGESTLNESDEMELADELLAVQSEDEMDRYLKRLFGKATRRRSMDRKMVDALVILLKGLSKKLFKRNRRNRHRFGSMMLEQENAFRAEFLGREFEGMDQEEQEFEARRSFVRLAGSAARHAGRMPYRHAPRWRARRALALAARKHAPGIYNPALLNVNPPAPLPPSEPSPALSQRLNSLESAIGSLTEKISNMKPPVSNPPAGTSNPPAKDDAAPADSEYESMYEDEWENEDHENEFEENEFEENEFENEYEEEFEGEDYEAMSNEQEDQEGEDFEYESEYEEQEAEDNENQPRAPRRKKRKCKCVSCKGAAKTNEFEENEFEENEYEENEYEENEFEENEFEENEFEENEFEENEFEEQEYEYEFENDGELPDRESTFSETMQMELASELLNIQTEEELDMFLGKLLKKAGKLVKKVSKIALPGPLGKVLKGIAKKVLPMAGGAIGGMFVPGLGNVVGKAVGDMASKTFEMEFEGMSQEDQEFEKAKAFVRFAGNAGVRSALLRPNLPPRAKAKVALKHAARKYAPGLLRKTPNRRTFRNNVNVRRNPVRHSAAYWKNKRNQRRRQLYRQQHPQRFTQYQRNLWRQRHPGRPFPINGYAGKPYRQQRPYAGSGYQPQPFQSNPYPQQQPYSQQPNDLPPQYPDQSQPGGGQDAPFSQKLSSLENALAQLTQKISSMNAPQGSNGHDLPSGNDDGGNDGGNEGQENEYWN
jgi:hypothetical protein